VCGKSVANSRLPKGEMERTVKMRNLALKLRGTKKDGIPKGPSFLFTYFAS
jgi:hypothetical protein